MSALTDLVKRLSEPYLICPQINYASPAADVRPVALTVVTDFSVFWHRTVTRTAHSDPVEAESARCVHTSLAAGIALGLLAIGRAGPWCRLRPEEHVLGQSALIRWRRGGADPRWWDGLGSHPRARCGMVLANARGGCASRSAMGRAIWAAA